MDDMISRQAAIETVKKHYRVDNDLLEVIAYEIEALPSAQPSLYGYDFRNLIVFADAVNKKGISDSEIEDFVRNARAAWEYAWEEFQRTQKEALDSIMRGDHHER